MTEMKTMKRYGFLIKGLISGIIGAFCLSFTGGGSKPVIDHNKLALRYFKEDAR